MNRKENALKKFEEGYNCAQAVACMYAEELGFQEEDLFRLMEGFGGGIAHQGHICGTISAMTMVESYRVCKDMLHMPNGKLETYDHIATLVAAFEQEIGCVNCKDILQAKDNTLINGKKHCCRECVMCACQLLDQEEK